MSLDMLSPPRNRLSYSKLRTYMECPKKYYYQNVDKYREKNRSSALCFGSAVDKAIEGKLKNSEINEIELFDAIWENQDVNGVVVALHNSLNVDYSYYDFDADLLLPEDISYMYSRAQDLVSDLAQSHSAIEVYEAVKNRKKQQEHKKIEDGELLYFNYCSWISLRRKGHMMINAFFNEVFPRFKQVLQVQPKISLKNEEGDEVVGYADLVAIWETGEEVVFDVKTSSVPYAKDSVKTSAQLTIYAHAMDKHTAGYIVLGKKLEKINIKSCSECGFKPDNNRAKTCTNILTSTSARCGGDWIEEKSMRVPIDVIIDNIPGRTEDIVIENIEEMNRGINSGIFMRNFNACNGMFGRCPYYDICYKNDASGLTRGDR